MSFLSSLTHFILGVPVKLKHFVNNPKVQAEFDLVAKDVVALLPYAIKAVQLVESKSGSRTATEIEAVLKEVGVLATIDPATPAGDPTLNGLLLQAASAALHGQLKIAINDAGKAGLKLGTLLLTESGHIPTGSILDVAVQIAYTFLKNSAGTTLIAAL